MSKHNHGHNQNLENDYPKPEIQKTETKPETNLSANQTSYKLLYWVLPVVIILGLVAYWISTNTPPINTDISKQSIASQSKSVSVSKDNSVSSTVSSTANSTKPIVPVTNLIKNISIISSNGLVIPNLKATIDGKEFLAKDNQINIQIENTKANLPITITGDGYASIKADKLEQVASLVQMAVNLPKSVEPIVATPAPTPAPTSPTAQVLSNRVAYTSDKDGVSRLYSAKSDGSDIKLLSEDMTVNSIINTRDSNVIFQTYPNETDVAVYKTDVNKGGLTKVTQFRQYEAKDGNYQQISYDEASGKRVRILENDYSNTSQIFVSRLWVANADGSNEKLVRERVYNDGYERVSGWKISPDGNKISYGLYKYDRSDKFVQSRLLVVDINNPSQFRTQWIDNSPNFTITEIGFSGDSRYHLYTIYNSGDQKSSTFIFDMTNTGFKEIKNLSAGWGQFSTDGKSYVFTEYRDEKANLFKINLSEATVAQLTNSGTVNAFYVNGSDIYIKQDKKVYFVGSDNQLIESKIETNNLSWRSAGAFYGGR